MSFLFASSHLPETTRRRNLLNGATHPLEEEEPEDDDSSSTEATQPMRHSGSVRAFSHLPPTPQQPVRAFRADPAPRRSSSVDEPEAGTSHALEPDDDHAAHGNTEGDAATGPHAPEDSRPWYQPRITRADLQAIGYDQAATVHDATIPAAAAARPWEHPAHDAGFDTVAPAGRSASRPQDTPPRTAPATQSMHDSSQPPTPDSAAQPYRPALPQSRLFEGRSAPQAFVMQQQGRGASGPASQQRPHTSQTPPAAPQPLQQQAQPSRAATPPAPGTKPAAQPQAPATRPAQNAPAAPQPLTGGTAAKQPQSPQFQVNEADENALFDLNDQSAGRPPQKGVKFGDHARSVINEELENSPTAVAALDRVRTLSGKNVVIHSTTAEQAYPRIGLDGTIHIYVNPNTLKPGTLAHEITHMLQRWHTQKAARTGKAQNDQEMKANNEARKSEVEAIAPVTVEGGDPNDEVENEAMRIGNIVKAEVSAAKVKARIEAFKESNPDKFNEMIKDPEKFAQIVANEFWKEMRPPGLEPKEGTKHQTNPYRIPESTIYGDYDFRHVLKALGNGVTLDILKKQTPWRKEYH